MVYVTKCEYSINNGRLEMEDVSGNHYSIDVYAVEDEYADNMYQRSSLDYLLYNEPVEYVNLLLSGELKNYGRQNSINLENWQRIELYKLTLDWFCPDRNLFAAVKAFSLSDAPLLHFALNEGRKYGICDLEKCWLRKYRRYRLH